MAETEDVSLLDYFFPDARLFSPTHWPHPDNPAGHREFRVCLLPFRLPKSNIHDINHLRQGNLNHPTCN
jgi:hypothetical protein